MLQCSCEAYGRLAGPPGWGVRCCGAHTPSHHMHVVTRCSLCGRKQRLRTPCQHRSRPFIALSSNPMVKHFWICQVNPMAHLVAKPNTVVCACLCGDYVLISHQRLLWTSGFRTKQKQNMQHNKQHNAIHIIDPSIRSPSHPHPHTFMTRQACCAPSLA